MEPETKIQNLRKELGIFKKKETKEVLKGKAQEEAISIIKKIDQNEKEINGLHEFVDKLKPGKQEDYNSRKSARDLLAYELIKTLLPFMGWQEIEDFVIKQNIFNAMSLVFNIGKDKSKRAFYYKIKNKIKETK